MHVSLTNPKSGDVKKLKMGWSWTVFFFGAFLGIPLFFRHLYALGSLFIELYVIYVLALLLHVIFVTDVIAVVQLVLTIWLAVVSNKMAINRHLKEGWTFADENAVSTQFAKEQLGLQ